MKYQLNLYNVKIPDDELLNDIRRIAKKHHSQTLSRAQYGAEGAYCPSTIRKRFGGWNNALRLAGLEIQKIPFITTQQLLENLKEVWDSLGRQPLVNEMKQPHSAYSLTAYVKRFGSWQKALEVFIKYGKKIRGKKPVLKTGFRKTNHALPPRRRGLKKPSRVNLALRYKILKHDNFTCRACGASPALIPGLILHVDHIIPVSKNGETTPENLQTLCSDCNYGKGGE